MSETTPESTVRTVARRFKSERYSTISRLLLVPFIFCGFGLAASAVKEDVPKYIPAGLGLAMTFLSVASTMASNTASSAYSSLPSKPYVKRARRHLGYDNV